MDSLAKSSDFRKSISSLRGTGAVSAGCGTRESLVRSRKSSRMRSPPESGFSRFERTQVIQQAKRSNGVNNSPGSKERRDRRDGTARSDRTSRAVERFEHSRGMVSSGRCENLSGIEIFWEFH